MPDRPHTYDKMSVIIIAVNDKVAKQESTERYDKVSNLIKLLLSETMSVEKKKQILQSEYEIAVERKTEKEMRQMCNLSEAIEERGIRKGIERGIEQGIERGIEQGIERGIAVMIETYRELGMTKEETTEKVRQKFDLTSEKTNEVMNRFWP